MTDGAFCHMSMADLANFIRGARRLAIIAAPGIDEAVASAIVLASQSIGSDNVRVILDVDEENCRAGYGNVDMATRHWRTKVSQSADVKGFESVLHLPMTRASSLVGTFDGRGACEAEQLSECHPGDG